MFLIYPWQDRPKDPDAYVSEQGARPFSKGTRGGQDDDPACSVPFHRIEEVSHTLGKDRRRLPSRRAEGAEHRVMSPNRAVHGSRVQNIASHNPQARVRNPHLCGISREGGDFVAFKEGLLCKEAARPSRGSE